jgi:hypothetical protein
VASRPHLHGVGACCTVVGGAARVTEGAGLKAQGVGEIFKIISVRRRSAPLLGFTPDHYGERLASGLMQPGPLPFRGARRRAVACIRRARASGRDHALPVLTTGRISTMDERLCRSVWRCAPDSRCGTAARRRRHARS